jgi:hypothetical protein
MDGVGVAHQLRAQPAGHIRTHGRCWTFQILLRIRRLGVRVPPSAPGQRPLPILEWPFLLPTLLPKPLTSRSEQLVYGVGRLLAKHPQDVRVGVYRDADLRVPEYLHDDPGRRCPHGVPRTCHTQAFDG